MKKIIKKINKKEKDYEEKNVRKENMINKIYENEKDDEENEKKQWKKWVIMKENE